GQLVAAEVALLGVVAVHRQPWPLLVPVLVAAVVVLVLCLARRSGRWAYQWADLGLRHLVARRSVRLPQAASPVVADALLDAVVDGGWLGRLDLDGAPAALWCHEGGLSVAVEVTATTAERPYLSRAVELPPVTALLPAADEGGARFSLQLLEQTHP
ncbi:hypothetical protein, partial [Curtobacterium sp. P97]|uniref:hypothetical protein n=1 Tax=Curtobacterium sp. P97 TaxID=2939562 RepID=UPI00203C9AC4